MKKFLYTLTVIAVLLFAIFYAVFKLTQNDITQILYITFMTFSYHFVMRLVVGLGLAKVHKKDYDYNSKWFRPKTFEKKLYKILKVKKWKSHIPAWSPESFETKHHTLNEIVNAMCGAEVVHEIIIVLSFVPVFFSLKYGVPVVFIITSFIAAFVDMVFVIVQRYNRPRIVKIISRHSCI